MTGNGGEREKGDDMQQMVRIEPGPLQGLSLYGTHTLPGELEVTLRGAVEVFFVDVH